MPVIASEKDRVVSVDSIFLHFLPSRSRITANQFARLFSTLQHVIALITDRDRDGERMRMLFGSIEGPVSPLLLEVSQIEFGSPLRILGTVQGISASSRNALVKFFRDLIFYEQESSKRSAEAALVWEQVVAARITNARAIAELTAPAKNHNEATADHELRVSTRADDLLSAATRLRSLNLRLTEFTIGDQIVHQKDSGDE